MKKFIIIAAVFFSLTTAGSVFAACEGVSAWALVDTVCTIGSDAKGGTLEIKGSKNVLMTYVHGNGLTYALGSYHMQGNRQFASTSNDQKIFYTPLPSDGSIVDCVAAPTGTAGASWTGWTAL
ncbi:MAG: hypothetical protein RQ824_03215 [bacterium]|nr:hypothetical protein [bacterium]